MPTPRCSGSSRIPATKNFLINPWPILSVRLELAGGQKMIEALDGAGRENGKEIDPAEEGPQGTVLDVAPTRFHRVMDELEGEITEAQGDEEGALERIGAHLPNDLGNIFEVGQVCDDSQDEDRSDPPTRPTPADRQRRQVEEGKAPAKEARRCPRRQRADVAQGDQHQEHHAQT
jgi:hypothetical protein